MSGIGLAATIFYATATLIENSVGENTLRKTDNTLRKTDNTFRKTRSTIPSRSTISVSAEAPRQTASPSPLPTMATNWNGPRQIFRGEYAAAALSGAIFLSPSKDTQFYAGCGAMQCDPAGADKGDTKAGARTRWHVDSP